MERKREKQLGRLQALSSEISKEERKLKLQQERERAHAEAKPKKLGKLKYQPRRPDVLLTEELPSSLRAMPSETSLLEDRFDSMQASRTSLPRPCPHDLVPSQLPSALASVSLIATSTSLGSARRVPHAVQARNLIEPRKRAPKLRKKQYKEVLRESHKDRRYTSPYLRDDQKPSWI